MKNTIKSLLLCQLFVLILTAFTGCTDKQIVCAIVTLEENEPCRQAQLAAQNEYAATVAKCNSDVPEICAHINDPVAKAACYQRVLAEKSACIKAAQDKLDAVNRATEDCYAKNKVKYDDCLAGK